MRYLFLINPTAGKGNAWQGVIDSINTFFTENGGEFKVHITNFKGEAEQIAKKEAQTGDDIAIFACGGEGTQFEVLNGIVGYDNAVLGVIPCGSANDFLKSFDDKQAFFDIGKQLSGEAMPMDIIKAGDKYCLNGCSVGMDAVVARDMSIFKKLPLVNGSAAYNLAVVKTMLKKLGVKIKLSVDGKDERDVGCLFAVIANGPCYGGGYTAAPDAIPNDGILNFTLVDIISKLKILKFLPVYKEGGHKNLECCHLSKCSTMEFKSDTKIPVNLDGEIIEKKQMSFSIIKNGIKFLVPSGVKLKNKAKKERILAKN